MNIILNIQGGLGKSIMATAVVKGLKKKHPKSYLIVVTAYPDVFLNNKNVDKTYTHDTQFGIFENYIHKQKNKVFTIDPYLTSEFINDESHLLEIWFNLCGLKYKGETPEFFLSKVEKQFYSDVYKTEKPILVIQTNGGAVNQNMQYNWVRDMPKPLVEKIINKYKKNYTIVHVKRKDQPVYPDTLQAIDGYRSIAFLLSISDKMLLIDSFAQHLAKAMNKKAVVLWCGTSSKVFGYDSHYNIQANDFTRKLTIRKNFNYKKFNLVEPLENCPYNDLNEIFDVKSIYQQLDK